MKLARKRPTESPATTIPKPDLEKQPKAIQFYNNLIQLDHEISLCKRLPEMRSQQLQLEKMRITQEKFLKACMAGFDPYNRMPSGWYNGFISKPAGANSGYRIYKRALPGKIIDAYLRAKELDVFDMFEVWSANSTIFQDVPATPKVDPVLVGWIGRGPTVHDGAVSFWEGLAYQPFLIGQWDLGSDLLASGLLSLPEPAAEVSDATKSPRITTALTEYPGRITPTFMLD